MSRRGDVEWRRLKLWAVIQWTRAGDRSGFAGSGYVGRCRCRPAHEKMGRRARGCFPVTSMSSAAWLHFICIVPGNATTRDPEGTVSECLCRYIRWLEVSGTGPDNCLSVIVCFLVMYACISVTQRAAACGRLSRHAESTNRVFVTSKVITDEETRSNARP